MLPIVPKSGPESQRGGTDSNDKSRDGEPQQGRDRNVTSQQPTGDRTDDHPEQAAERHVKHRINAQVVAREQHHSEAARPIIPFWQLAAAALNFDHVLVDNIGAAVLLAFVRREHSEEHEVLADEGEGLGTKAELGSVLD